MKSAIILSLLFNFFGTSDALTQDLQQSNEAKRELVRNADNNKLCFDLNYNQGYADYVLDPFKANENRGDWGKCMNGQLFGAMCIHDEMHAINNGQWVKGEGPMHDGFAESMFLRLKELHNDYCLHVDVKFTPVMKAKLNDHIFARNQYSMIAKNDTTNTFTFETLIDSTGNYYINGNTNPILQLLKGNTYYFIMRNEDYAKYPLTFGPSIGTPFSSVTISVQYDMTKITVSLPFDVPDSIVYYASNGATKGGTANLLAPSYFKITPRDGAYYVNNIAGATLSLQRGVKYSFVLSNSDQKLFPFMIGTSYGVPYLGGSITVQSGTYYTTFTVTITDPAVTKLIYYCANNPSMFGAINLPISFANPVKSGSRSLAMAMEDDDGFGLPFDTTCTGNYKTGDPRAVLRMSLYCAIARMQTSIPNNILSKPYAISSSCDKIARTYLTTQLYTPKNLPPLQFCKQQTVPVDGLDTCTVQAPVYNFQGRTCKDYCEGFDGLTCSAASVMNNGIYCQAGRSWNCNTPQQNEWTLLCTCAPKPSGSSTPNSNLINSPSAAPSTSVKNGATALKSTNKPSSPYPTARPSFKPTPVSTIPPTNYPITIYQTNQYIASSCLTLMRNTLYQASSVCQQNLVQDSCTVLAPMKAFLPVGSCTKYCKANGLSCVSAYDGWNCGRGTQRTCDFNRTDTSLCECGQPTAVSIPSLSPVALPIGNSFKPSVQSSNYPLIGSYYFIGCYTDQSTRSMSTSAGRKTITDCANYAATRNFQYFGLQNYYSSSGDGECWLSNDLIQSTRYGTSSFSGTYATCVYDSAGLYKYGLGWTNAIYTANTYTPAVPTKSPSAPAELNTKSCATMVFYHNGPYSPGSKICPRYTVTPQDVDSCTAQPYNSQITCAQYCSSFPGLTCLDGAAANSDSCAIDPAYGKIGCNAVGGYYKLCTCGINQPAMTSFEAKKNESISNACLNLMFQPQPVYTDRRQICSSSLSDNSCLITVPNSYTCSQYCSSYPGMTCMNSYVPNSYRSCYADNTQSITCDSKISTTDSILCRCGFAQGAPHVNSLRNSLFDSNLPYCPAYPKGTFTDDSIMNSNTYRRKLDDWNDKQLYGRRYKKITLTIDYNPTKADGSARVISADTRWDTQDWSTDTYSTATPEMCTGLVSRIRKGDPASKCSFGNRPGGNPSENCYGKLYSMTFAEASNKCAARGGNLARIDSAKEFAAVTSMFQNDNELSIGLYDKSGGDWRWDGFSDTVPTSWLNSTIRFRSNSWYDDCSKISFNYNGQRKPYLSTASCSDKRTYLCEGKSVTVGDNTVGGDLLADEGGFCIWYYQNPKISLPDDESANFRNTELAYFNLYDPKLTSRKYVNINNKLYSADNIPGNPANKANFQALTGRKFGKNSDDQIIPSSEFNSSFHCHFSPTNFGMYRIYDVQHMLQRLYTGAAKEHCFCGYKNIGHLFDRCDCTRSGEQDNQCLTEHATMLYDETFAETGEYVRCNNCNNPSP